MMIDGTRVFRPNDFLIDTEVIMIPCGRYGLLWHLPRHIELHGPTCERASEP